MSDNKPFLFVLPWCGNRDHMSISVRPEAHGLLCSISARGNCYDTAWAESIFHLLKGEAILSERFETNEEIKKQNSSTSTRITI